MSIYEEYESKYNNMVADGKAKGNTLFMKKALWITMTYCNDKGVEPFEKEPFDAILEELKQAKDVKMLEAIRDTLIEIVKE